MQLLPNAANAPEQRHNPASSQQANAAVRPLRILLDEIIMNVAQLQIEFSALKIAYNKASICKTGSYSPIMEPHEALRCLSSRLRIRDEAHGGQEAGRIRVEF